MSFNFKRIKLKELCIDGKGKYGIPASSVPYDKNLFTYLRITDITDDGKINKNNLVSVDDDNAKNYILNINDIVFARTGASTGRNYFYDGLDGEFVYAGFLIKFSIDDLKVNPKYIKYYCQSQEYKNWVSSFNTGSTRGNINANTFGNMEIPIIPRKQQDLLVDILSCLDEKIELNNKINKNLEEMAQAIFKKWFIDFDYPLTEEEIANGGREFVDSELGKIPKGWSVVELGKFMKFIKGKKPKEIIEIKINELMEYLTIDVLNYKCNLYADKNKMVTCDILDILMVMDGASCGDVYFGKNGIVASTLAKLEIYDNNIKEIVYQYLIFNNYNIKLHKTGSAIPHTDKNYVLNLKIVIPSSNILNIVSKYFLNIRNIIINNKNENEKLTQIRDTLLPKLINGDVRVSY